jgi:hypothetical protein
MTKMMHSLFLPLLLLIFSSKPSQSFQPACTLFSKNRQQLEPSSTRKNSFSISTLDSFYETQPYVAAFLTCAFKGSVADALAQSKHTFHGTDDDCTPENHSIPQIQTKGDTESHLDYIRNLAFILYGGFYQGMGQTFLYTCLYPTLFGSDPTLSNVLATASMENFVMAPFFCLPCVYTIKSLLEGDSMTAGLEKYWDHIFSQKVLVKYWSLWFPVQTFNFAVVPEHLRVPFGALFSFFWVCLLSTISSQEIADDTSDSTVTSIPVSSREKILTPATISCSSR